MSLDRSLKGADALVRHRNVLTRTERLDKLAEEERWDESKSVFGLPKVEHRKQAVAKGPAKEEAEATAAAGTAPAAPGAVAGAAPAAPAGKEAKGAAAAAKAAPGAAKAAAPATPAKKRA
ncbi:MAG: small basic protein [Tepidisphaeraceae bacterium]|jgi:small basic protein (TIGR04137 family)